MIWVSPLQQDLSEFIDTIWNGDIDCIGVDECYERWTKALENGKRNVEKKEYCQILQGLHNMNKIFLFDNQIHCSLY